MVRPPAALRLEAQPDKRVPLFVSVRQGRLERAAHLELALGIRQVVDIKISHAQQPVSFPGIGIEPDRLFTQ